MLRIAAVYVPVLTYTAVYPTDSIVIGCCPVYVPAVQRTGAGVGTIFALCCSVINSLIQRLTVV